jgi:hypothetical protein
MKLRPCGRLPLHGFRWTARLFLDILVNVLKRWAVLCLYVCVLALALRAADVSGIWTGQIVDRNGDSQDFSFRFAQSGDSLTGKMYGENESTPIAGGKIAGSRITFTVTNELNGQVNTFVYTGTMNGDEIEVTRERVNLKNGPVDPNRQNQKQTVRLRRVA